MATILKNEHSDAELKDMGERWVNHQRAYLTLVEVLAIKQARQFPESPESQAKAVDC